MFVRFLACNTLTLQCRFQLSYLLTDRLDCSFLFGREICCSRRFWCFFWFCFHVCFRGCLFFSLSLLIRFLFLQCFLLCFSLFAKCDRTHNRAKLCHGAATLKPGANLGIRFSECWIEQAGETFPQGA